MPELYDIEFLNILRAGADFGIKVNNNYLTAIFFLMGSIVLSNDAPDVIRKVAFAIDKICNEVYEVPQESSIQVDLDFFDKNKVIDGD